MEVAESEAVPAVAGQTAADDHAVGPGPHEIRTFAAEDRRRRRIGTAAPAARFALVSDAVEQVADGVEVKRDGDQSSRKQRP